LIAVLHGIKPTFGYLAERHQTRADSPGGGCLEILLITWSSG
jgi:hypothetical protein